MKKLILIMTLALSVGLLAACGSDDSADSGTESAQPEITDVWARTTTPTQETSAIYMTIKSADGDALTGVSVPKSVAGKAEIHETTGEHSGEMESKDSGEMDPDDSSSTEDHGDANMADDHASGDDDMGGDHGSGMVGMHEVDRIEIPAGEDVRLEPGGYHVMLMELAGPVEPGATIPVTLTFEKAGEIEVDATAEDM